MISASMLSEENAAWAKQIPIPESGWETTYCGMEDPVILNGREQYLILLSEKLIDTQAGSQELGTIVFLLGEDYIRQSLDFDENSQVYILNGETVISAEDKSEIGLSSSQVLNDKHCVYTKKRVTRQDLHFGMSVRWRHIMSSGGWNFVFSGSLHLHRSWLRLCWRILFQSRI